MTTTAATATTPAEEFLDALRRADEQHAVAVATRLVDQGVPAQEVLLGLVAAAQERVGRLWETGEWSVAQEHAATCISERAVAAVAARTRSRGGRGHVVLGCLDGEWHALAARIVAEVLRLHDWRVTYLGASVPAAHLVSYLHLHGPDVVALSCALPIHLPAAHRTIVAAQRTGTPVLVGGPGFGADGRWARRLGVDAWAPTAVDAVALLDALPWQPPAEQGALDAAGGAEYSGLRERRPALIATAAAHLDEGLAGDEVEAEDAAQLVDFLAAAVYLTDGGVLDCHLRWLAAVLAARGHRADGVVAALGALRAELHDFPFAQACLDRGRLLVAAGGADRGRGTGPEVPGR
ncbi:MAG TPA: cobalamin-dependent protein [Pseudonocardia sp.]|nr:cobalamin-dependent protein [Pseudonocardia sp.]